MTVNLDQGSYVLITFTANRGFDVHACDTWSFTRASAALVVQPCLCWTWSETPKTGFLTTRLNFTANQCFDVPVTHAVSPEPPQLVRIKHGRW